MKKFISLFIICMTMITVFGINAYAFDLPDGTYEVPVTLMHKEKEKESTGNGYIAQTALLKIENGEKTITIFLTTDMNGIEFSYYTNGTLDGDVADGTLVSNVTLAGETYERGYEIPVTADNDIGLKFSVPVMPMSPSARLRIDYNNAVLISSGEAATTQEATTAEQTTVAETVAETTVENTTEKVDGEETTVSEQKETTTANESATQVQTETVQTAAEKATVDNSDSSAYIYSGIFIVVVLLSAVILFADERARRKYNKSEGGEEN